MILYQEIQKLHTQIKSLKRFICMEPHGVLFVWTPYGLRYRKTRCKRSLKMYPLKNLRSERYDFFNISRKFKHHISFKLNCNDGVSRFYILTMRSDRIRALGSSTA